ncbi:hypoxia-inducible factor 1-alpha-like isoform X2 [Plodia interpunctella]|uniref:hypoxia-inducible factor 1-alpha-like isoform X2 n=1 Tax=Plodia interpunctella TaxID=58824 RepID=UPI002368758F|nr:hypoxia-inducible factor 1-alpha-like isoform X2 [Plodia interpunctella]
MLVNGDHGSFQPINQYEESRWNSYPRLEPQWPVQNVCNQSRDYVEPPAQCYNYVNQVPQFYPQGYQPPVFRYVQPPQPIIPNLPCHQVQQWNYNTMCFDVDGQPCQYTGMVDLEDFMNNEKRKEKSRVAARCRRTKEMQIFTELTAALPAKKEEVEQLDKASVMRLAISYLRVRDVVSMLPGDTTEQSKLQSPKGLEEVSSELSYMKALDGFVLVLSQQGDIVYCSENIADHLGVSQMEIMGQSVFEFSHPCDHDEIREALRSNGGGRRDLLLRLKCTLTSKGRNVHLKSASYKVVHITGHMLTAEDKKESIDKEEKNAELKSLKSGSLIAVGRPIPHPSNIEIPLDNKTFLSKHSLDMKITYTDEALLNTLGFEPDEMVGRSLYDYHHAADSASLAQHFKSLFSKGQCETGQYRFLAKKGGFAWVQTQATLITDKQQKPISVVCVNYVISGIECKDEVFATHQVQHVDLKPVVLHSVPTPVVVCPPLEVSNGIITAPSEKERPIPVTEQILFPRKEEMNTGFLTFHDEGLTMLKDEPDDLTHLAPTAGDTCVPLENNSFYPFDDDFILSGNYCSLLGDDLANTSPVDSLTPDSLFLSSPEPQETESSCEQSSLLNDLSLDAFDGARSDNEIDDGNSPFIPMNDELPVLESAVMWGALPDNVSLARPQPSDQHTASPTPALQRLLVAPTTGPAPQDLISNIYSDQGLIPSKTVSSWDTGIKRVMKQEEEPNAKRVKRSPSPTPTSSPKNSSTKPSSSVLMNLLDIQQQHAQRNKVHLNYQMAINSQQNPARASIPIPAINLQPAPKLIPTNSIPNNIQNITEFNVMSPLSLNIGSPMYSLPSSPNTSNYSPNMSPAQKDRVLSPYSTPQSPVGKYLYSPGNRPSPTGVIQGSDPYLTNKMQPSPGFSIPTGDLLLESNVGLSATDFWTDSEMLQGTNDLLSAFDDVKLA